MTTTLRRLGLPSLLLGLAALTLAPTASAQHLATSTFPTTTAQVTGFTPACGTAGDLLLIRGTFRRNPDVEIGGEPATIIRHDANRILVRVPRQPNATPPTDVRVVVDAESAPDAYRLLEPGSPVVLRMADRVTEGSRVRVAGLRFGQGSRVHAVDGTGQATRLQSAFRRRIGVFSTAPLAPGRYTIVITNGLGLDTEACSPELVIVAPSPNPTLTSIEPAAGQLPGRRVLMKGDDLVPRGLWRVAFTDASGSAISSVGFSDGSTMLSFVPRGAAAGPYQVSAHHPRSGATNALAFTVISAPQPDVQLVFPDEGTPGTSFFVIGESLLGAGPDRPIVQFVRTGAVPVRCDLLFGRAGANGLPDLLGARVPRGTSPGIYGVQVVDNGFASNHDQTFEVTGPGVRPLTVTAMSPRRQPASGPLSLVKIEGAGFGNAGDFPLEVVWVQHGPTPVPTPGPVSTPAPNPSTTATTASGAGTTASALPAAFTNAQRRLPGRIVSRGPQRLEVVPPGGRTNPLPVGDYEVFVVRVLPSGAEVASAGRYVVEP